MSFEATRPIPGVLHLRFPDQASITHAMIRIQEFYESPHEELRGKTFDVGVAEALHLRTHGDTYYEHWHGFNVPMTHVYGFFNSNYNWSLDELAISRVIDVSRDKYLIATHQDCDYDHEMCHALWGLCPAYRGHALQLLEAFVRCMPALFDRFRDLLLAKGYGHEHLSDEMNAYLTEAPHSYFVDELGFCHSDAFVLMELQREHARLLKWGKEWYTPDATL